jgi:hypothetical protein
VHRSLIVTVVAFAALCAASCGGHTPREDAYLATLQKIGSQIELADPDGDLDKGHEVCDILEKTKPADRYTMGGVLLQQGAYGGDIIYAATEDLCPEYKGSLS